MSGPVQVHILHQEFGGITRVLNAKAEIGQAFDPADPTHQLPTTAVFDAIWDTGASGTVITRKVVDALGLKPVGAAKIFHAQGETIANVYLISLRFPGGVGFASLRVTEGVLNGFEVLIGMDVIASGDLLITNHEGRTRLTFQCPPQGGASLLKNTPKLTIGGTVQVTPGQPLPQPRPPKPYAGTPRNDPCPCGSGIKYKKCHGN